MKKNIFTCALIILLLGNSCSFANPVKDMAKKIKQMGVTSYELKWMVQDEEQVFIVIYEGAKEKISNKIKDAMNYLVPSGGSQFISIGLASYGILTLKDEKDFTIDIGISPLGFSAYNGSTLACYFYSKKLSNIINDMVNKSEYKNRLIMEDDLFEILSKKKEVKLIE